MIKLENITIEQILGGIGIIVALGAGAYKLWQGFKTAVGNAVSEQFEALSGTICEIKTSLSDLEARINEVDMEGCKNFLVRCISDFEKNQPVNETELERFWEQYDYYLEHDGNSYIRTKVEKLKAEGKI